MMKWLVGGLLALVGLAALIAIAGYFALKRPDIAYETLAARYESAASRYVDLPDGVHMHYRDEGNPTGPTLLLVHGFAASLHTWTPWVERLGGEYRIVTLDLPGHGLTRAPAGYRGSIEDFRDAVAAFASAQNLNRFTLAGSSMGGHVAWEYALAHPEQVEALILVDSAGWRETSPDASQSPLIFQLLRNPVTRPLLRDLDATRLTRMGLISAFPKKPELVDAAMVSRYVELARAPGHRDILMNLMMGTPPAASDETLEALAMPVLILHGSQDTLVPLAHAQLFKGAIPQAELAIYDGVGHVPQEEIPDESAAAVRDFLARTRAAPAQ